MGEVYRGFDTRLNRPVAIKLLRTGDTDQSDIVERFLREARAASALNHPNIVTIHDVGETDDGELLHRPGAGRRQDAADSSSRPRSAGRRRWTSAGRWRTRWPRSRGRHRPPGHQAREHHGARRRLREGARLRRSRASSTIRHPTRRDVSGQDTAPGTVLGTTAYMSPEQARGTPGRSGRGHLRARRHAVRDGDRPRGRSSAPSSIAVLAAILSEQPVPLARLNPATPAALDALVHRMLAKEPDERPTARDVDEELRVFQCRRDADRTRAASAAAPRNDGRPRGRARATPPRATRASRRPSLHPGRVGRGRHRQDQPGRGLLRRADVAARPSDRRARPLLGAAGGRGSLSADPRRARSPAASRTPANRSSS